MGSERRRFGEDKMVGVKVEARIKCQCGEHGLPSQPTEYRIWAQGECFRGTFFNVPVAVSSLNIFFLLIDMSVFAAARFRRVRA